MKGDRQKYSTDYLKVEKSDIWSLLNWQQNQVHHYQLMARGILALIITLVSILIASLATSLIGPIQPLPNDYSGIGSAVEGTLFGENAGTIIIGLNVFLIIILLILFSISILKSIYWFMNVILDLRLDSGIDLSKRRIIMTKESDNRTQLHSILLNSIYRNEKIINDVEESFNSAMIRLLQSVMLAVGIYIIHSYIVDLRIGGLFAISLLSLIPIEYYIGIPRQLSNLIPLDATPSQNARLNDSKFQPYIDALDQSASESFLTSIITVIYLLITISGGISIIGTLI